MVIMPILASVRLSPRSSPFFALGIFIYRFAVREKMSMAGFGIVRE